MARLKRLAPTQLAEVGATKKFTLGQRYEQAATSLHGERTFMYIEYNDGAGNVTCGTNDVLVPYFAASAGENSRYTYTADKSDMGKNSGRRAALAMGRLTNTNKYGFVQIKGDRIIYASGSASIVPGQQLYATAGGTDKVGEPVEAGITITTTDLSAIQNVFAECLDGSATATTAVINVYLYGF